MPGRGVGAFLLEQRLAMKHSTLRRATLASAALLASLALYACGASGSIDVVTHIDPPFTPPITIKVSASTDGTKTMTASGGSSIAHKCVEVTYSDAEGNTTGTTTLQADGSGMASGQVPPGSVRWSAVVVDCPDPEPEPEPVGGGESGSGGDGWFRTPSALSLEAPLQTQQSTAQRWGEQEFIVQGGPIVPSADASNLTYFFVVQANSIEEARALTEPILLAGPGATVPSRVEVIHFSTTLATPDGIRILAAQPGEFLSWDLTVNEGTFQADLDSALHYQVGSWDVMEALVPIAAFEGGAVPGMIYSNEGELVYSTDRLGGVASGAFRLSLTAN